MSDRLDEIHDLIIRACSQSRFDMLAGDLKADHAIKNTELGGGLNLDKSLQMFYERIADLTTQALQSYIDSKIIEAREGGLDKPSDTASVGGNQVDNFSDPTDEGELTMAVYVKDEVVVIDFGKDLSWIGLDRPTLEPLIKLLQEKLEQI